MHNTKLNKFEYDLKSIDKLILVLINSLFILSTLIPIDGNVINYAVTILISVILFSYLLFIKRIDLVKYHFSILLLLTLITILLLFPIIHKHDLYMRLFVVKLILVIFLFKTSDISTTEFSKIINLTYLVYLVFSILIWAKLLPGLQSVNSFIIHIGSLNIETLYGISGSTADIDTYSGIIFLWNLFIYRGRYKNLILFISLIALVLTFRGTPIVVVAASIMVYFIVRTKFIALLSLLSILLGLSIVLLLVSNQPDEQVFFLTKEKDWYTFFWDVTHARSALWNNQISLYINNFTWYQYIYGPDLQNMTVYFTRPDGLELKENYNPHSSYLITLYRSTIFFVILYLGFLYYGIKTYNRASFPIIFSIALAALTNSSLFGLENPVYILMIVYIYTKYNKNKNISDSQIRNNHA